MSYILSQSPPCSSSTDTSSVHLNNATNSYSNTISQLLPSHGAYFHSNVQFLGDVGQNARENVPPSENATVSSGSKRKADLDENCSGLNLQKAWVPPITQEPSQTPFAIPPQLQEPQAWPQQPQGGSNGTNTIIQGVHLDGFYIPPEIVAINIELNDLPSCIAIPHSPSLLTTTVVREDFPDRTENRVYPYLWFPGRPPRMLQQQEYQNILSLALAGALKKVFHMLGIGHQYGTLGLTARRQPVIFFEVEEMEAMKKQTNSNLTWQAVSGQNNFIASMEHHLEQGAQGGSGSKPPRKRTGKRPAQNSDTMDHDTPNRCRNGPSPGMPIHFAEIQTKESFRHPQNTSAAPRSDSKRRQRVRASANSRALGKDAMAKKRKTQRGKRHITKGEPSEIEAGPSGTRDSEPEIEPVYSFSRQVSSNILYQLPAPTDQVDLVNLAAADMAHSAQLIAPSTDESHLHAQAFYSNGYQHVRHVNQDPLGQGEASVFEFDFATSGGYNWQPQPSHAFDANNLTDGEFFNFMNSVERNLQYDTVEQSFDVQARGSTSGFPGSLAGDFTGLPSWELN